MQGVFVGTFLIGLREGLEATLIVSIVAAFLKRNDKSVRPMFVGIMAAVAISIAVGAGLELVANSLQQAQQEMLETVIGAIAVVFVTTMIIWMNRNAMHMKGDLEREAAQAINTGGAFALAAMAFLAVLKEGFETAVFLLAAAQATHGSRWSAVLGGVAGITGAIAVGVGIYRGGVKLNLGRFFRITGIFLVFIAAGLVTSSLRTAHEADWVTVGQRQIFDFSAWMPANSVVGALITGMFGIPTDPRLIEVLGWLLYAVPVLIVFLWPRSLVAAPATRRRLLLVAAAGLAAVAVAMATAIPDGGTQPGPSRNATTVDGHTVTAALRTDGTSTQVSVTDSGGEHTIPLTAAGHQDLDGVAVEVWQSKVPADAGINATTVTLGQLAQLTGGRLPVGLGTARTPGPFEAQWTASTAYTVLAQGDSVISADAASSRVATLRGGGLAVAKVVSVGGLATDWATVGTEDHAVAARVAAAARDRGERRLWTVWLPTVLAAAALLAVFAAVRVDRGTSKNERAQHHHGETPRQDQVGVS